MHFAPSSPPVVVIDDDPSSQWHDMRHAKLIGLLSMLAACDAPGDEPTRMRSGATLGPIDEVALESGGTGAIADVGTSHDDATHGTWSDAPDLGTVIGDDDGGTTSFGGSTSFGDDHGTTSFGGSTSFGDDDGGTTSGDDTCGDEHDPVCGTDGLTYLSACWAADVGIDRVGPCEPSEPSPPLDGSRPCTDDCPPTLCGDGQTGAGEACDDGNRFDDDGCSSHCEIEGQDVCGDGWRSYAEQCDDGNLVDDDTCSNACLRPAAPPCGNGILDLDEECDDGDVQDGDGCSSACLVESSCQGGHPSPSPDFAPGIRRFCGSRTLGLNLQGFVVGARACVGNVENHERAPGLCAEPPKDPVAEGGTNHKFTDGKIEGWKVTLALPIAFEKVPVLGKLVGSLGPEWESQFVQSHELNTWLEVMLDSGQLPTVFVKGPGNSPGKWMRAGALVSARRVAESKDGSTADHKFSIKAWIIGGESATSDGRYKSVQTAVTFKNGEGDYGGSVAAKQLLGKPDLDDDTPVSVADVTAALRKKMEGPKMRAKLEQQHSEALAAAGYVWAQAKVDYGCGLGPDGNGGLTKVCVVPWCHYDAYRGEKNWLGKLSFTLKYTSSGLFRAPVVGGKGYVIGNGSADNPDERRVYTRNCSRYEIKADTMVNLPYFEGSVYERSGWGILDENGRIEPTLMATGAKTCTIDGDKTRKCFFLTRTLDDGNIQASFKWAGNQLSDKERQKF